MTDGSRCSSCHSPLDLPGPEGLCPACLLRMGLAAGAATTGGVAKHRQTSAVGLGKELRGDLDAITLKAMEKDRTRRYASASEFAADIERYLEGDAVRLAPSG